MLRRIGLHPLEHEDINGSFDVLQECCVRRWWTRVRPTRARLRRSAGCRVSSATGASVRRGRRGRTALMTTRSSAPNPGASVSGSFSVASLLWEVKTKPNNIVFAQGSGSAKGTARDSHVACRCRGEAADVQRAELRAVAPQRADAAALQPVARGAVGAEERASRTRRRQSRLQSA